MNMTWGRIAQRVHARLRNQRSRVRVQLEALTFSMNRVVPIPRPAMNVCAFLAAVLVMFELSLCYLLVNIAIYSDEFHQ